MAQHLDPIVVVGAGVFGLSIALELRQRGHTNITVIDRMLPPVADGSSNDANRIIRPDYVDPFYARIATEAVREWNAGDLYRPHYHQAGFALVSETEPGRDEFLERGKRAIERQGNRYVEFATTDELRRLRPELRDMTFPFSGYISKNAGWADAAGAVRAVAARCSELGIAFVTGPRGTMTSLKTDAGHSRVVGVNVAAGPPLLAAKVILATGAWTNHYVDLGHAITSSAQPVGFIQLTPEEALKLADMPVVDNMTSGIFVFPPTPGTNLLKIARHGHGFENRIPAVAAASSSASSSGGGGDRRVSAPRHDANNAAASWIPEDAEAAFRGALKQLVPLAAEKPWSRLRLCWYTETRDGNFIADHHPDYQGLFILTGGSGHGFKFLPVLGRYTADCFEGVAAPEVQAKWKLSRDFTARDPVVCNDGSRRGPLRRELTLEERAKL
ncbi:Fructosyl amino acid [Colletotrichum higginsianum IMI 349063]|uniref:Fructosyl amino acid n=2 Tax=Colletotrichum higginsianum TaxID=80884 RepID=A0A1B7YT38_COLHI|nr:Fructosyl amino acid [Colletotrichum higginsianum IMI 349063]OBR15048.1 Fructosyl amino acid [Colletotrichum higginsianum IMI 349063]TID04786.1 L-pipecolate oxidase [Colletotrichum higginsianum]GJC92677.1 fructosyl amino acid [Colletotrichum higginsianum]